jgi:hypothetical protein
VVYAAEENGQDSNFGRLFIYLEVEDKILVRHRANARSDFCVFRAPVRMGDESPHGGKGVVDPSGRTLESTFQVLPKFLAGFKEMFLNEIKVACDIRRAADAAMRSSWPLTLS